MTTKRMSILLALATGLLALPAAAQITTVITFDGVPANVVCNEVWQENGVDVFFTETTAEDCTLGACYFGVDSGQVWLYPSRLVIDFGQTYAITQVEIDWVDYCGQNCTRAFLYDGAQAVGSAGNSIIGTPETVTLLRAGAQADRLAISSCEGVVREVRITAAVVSSTAETWSTVKSLYR